MVNKKVAEIFSKIAQILEIKGDNPFRIRAYLRAVENIDNTSADLSELSKLDKLKEIPGIGDDLAVKIKEIVDTGKLKYYDDLVKTIPAGLLDLLEIPGLGPKRAKLFYEKLDIKGIPDLEKAISSGKLLKLEGIKEKTIDNIQKGIALIRRGQERMVLSTATQTSEYFIDNLKKLSEVKEICAAGSLRRQKETVRDIDILVISDKPEKIMDKFTELPEVKRVLAKGGTKASVITKDDAQVDLRVLEKKSFGAALLYFTGSKQFNIKLRQIAQKKNIKLNEYGIFKGNKFLAGRTEEEMFKSLGLSYIEPELREDQGEIELAKKNALPQLIEAQDIRGDLHVHSNWSDGFNSITEIAHAAEARDYEYIAISDHSQSLRVANGVSVKDLIRKRKEIDKVNYRTRKVKVLFGTEVEIDSQGRIDYPEKVLQEFDIVIAAIHSGFKQSKQQLTKRIISACKNKYVNIIAHPFGRLFGTRDFYEIDFDEILKVARQTNTFMEINSFPSRLDLNDINSKRAKEAGVKLAVNTDSHAISQLEFIKFGLSTARRGWLEKDDVINTSSLAKLLKLIKK